MVSQQVYYDETLGTLLLGIFFNTYLYGLVTYQFAAYYRAKFNDRPATRYMVLFLFILDTFHSAAVIYMAWNYTVTNYNNPSALKVAEWPYTFSPIGTALAAVVTQMYQVFRVWQLTKNKPLCGIIIILSITSCVLGIISGIRAWIIRFVAEFVPIIPFVTSWLATQVVTDLLICGTLITVFSRSRTGFRKTDTLLQRLIRGAIQTSVFAGLFSIGDLISFAIVPSYNFHGMFSIPIGRIYTNTLMDTLLTREVLRSEMSRIHGSWETPGPALPPDNTRARPTSIRLNVKKTIQVTYDPDRSSKEGADSKAIPLEVV